MPLIKHRHKLNNQRKQRLKTNFRKKYYSTFASGLENFVLSFLSKNLSNFKCLKLLDGGIIYATTDSVEDITFFKNTFLVIKTVTNTDNLSLEKIITQLFFIARIDYKLEKKSFRIFAFDKNQHYSIKPSLLSKMETEIVKKLHLKIDRANSYYHFWFLKRSENLSLFLLKINSKKPQKPSKGELHRDIIEPLIEIAGMDKNDIFFRPFRRNWSYWKLQSRKRFSSNYKYRKR
jgi:hypothetical protein